MRKGFTKIPNDILDQPWATNPTAVYLYTWLALNADRDGNIKLSLNELVKATGLNKMTIRRTLQKLNVTQHVTQVATQPATQLPSTITVCYLSSCKGLKTNGDTASDTGSDTACDTPRAYKNDINIIMSCKTNKDIPPYPPKGEGEYDWSVVPDNLKPIVEEWLKYKREKKQSYKPTGFKSFSKLLNEYSGGDERKARMIIEQSMANNWAGIFELKTSNDGTDRQSGQQSTDHPSNEQLLQQTRELINAADEREKQGYNSQILPF